MRWIFTHRTLELAGMVAVAALASGLAFSLASASGRGAWQPLAAALLLAHPAADLLSGVVHWAADRALPVELPYLGPNFVEPFRAHHADPVAIARHDFLTTNGNTCVALAPPLAATWWCFEPTTAGPVGCCLAAFALGLAFWLCLTNQIHKWAHTATPPRAVRWLQRRRVILSPVHHAAHHAPPFDRHYCITAGWLDRMLDGSHVFVGLERLLAGCGHPALARRDRLHRQWPSPPTV